MKHPEQFIQALRDMARDGAAPSVVSDHLSHAARVIDGLLCAVHRIQHTSDLESAHDIAHDAIEEQY